MNEFQLIERFFCRPAADTILGVGDDAAIIRPSPGCDLHLSADMLVAGRHFLPDTDPRALGHKALAVNLSDMAAMGARPRWVLLSLALPASDETWLAQFAEGLFTLAAEHEVSLIGGDTTSGPLTLSVTIIGETLSGQALRRDAARAGDDIWFSGEVGMAALALKNGLTIPADIAAECKQRLDRPTPRVALGRALLPLARACLDVSDGVCGDLSHILQRSQVGATLWFEALPAHPWLAARRDAYQDCLLAGGDDYELLFTADVSQRAAIEQAARQCGVAVTRIGVINAGSGLRVLDGQGAAMTVDRKGYDHFGDS